MMNTIAFDKTGSPEQVLQIIEKEKPVPGDNEVLVKLLASPINPSDIFFIQGTYRFKPEFPDQVAGFEGAGMVESSGCNAGIPNGSLVAFFYKRAWAEYIVVPAEELVLLPNDFPIEKAAQFNLNPFTAWGLLDTAQPVAAEWILLTGANSSVSRIVIQLARQRGLRIIALVREMARAPGLRSLGADEVFDMEDPRLSDHIERLTEGKGINIAFDAVGGPIGTIIFKNMTTFGRFLIYGATKNEPGEYFNAQLVYKNLSVKGFGIRSYLNNQAKTQRAEMIQGLIDAMEKPSFQLPVTRSYKWHQFKEALKENSVSGRTGKVLLIP